MFGNSISWVKGAMEVLINWLIDRLNGMIDKINLVAGWAVGNIGAIGHVGGTGTPAGPQGPAVPGHATGGIFTRKHLAWIAEKGPEAVIPLRNGRIPGGSPLSFGGGGGSISVGPITVHGTADAAFAKKLASELATQLRGGRVPAFQQAIAAV